MQSTPRLMHGVMSANAFPYERVLASNVQRLLDLDPDRIRNLWNPQTCDVADLPYLAWALSVDIWNPDWDEQKKRRVVANAFLDHARKGTQKAIETYLGYEDITVAKMVVPPARCFAVQGMTDAQREAYIAALPQIRIYPYWTDRTAPKFRAFMKGPAGSTAFFGAAFMQASHGPQLYGRRATFEVPGEPEVDCTLDELPVLGEAPSEQVRIDFTGSKRAFLGHFYQGQGFMQTSRASTRIVAVRLADGAPAQFAALSGLQLQDVRPVRVYQTRQAPKGRFFIGRDFLGSTVAHMEATAAPTEIYDRFALVDPAVTPNLQPGRSFMGSARFGIAPFTAEARIEVPMHRPRWRLGVGRGQFLTGFVKKTDFTKLERGIQAASAAKSFRDTILIDPEIYRTVQLGHGLKLGNFKLNQVMKRT